MMMKSGNVAVNAAHNTPSRCQHCQQESRCERLLAGEKRDETFCVNARLQGGSNGVVPRPFLPQTLGMVMPLR